MSRDTIVAKRYAKALFEVALGQQKVLEVEQELRTVVIAITGDAEIGKFIESPNISEEAKQNVLRTSLDGKVSEPVLKTVLLLIERGRVELLEALLNDYVKIEGESLGIADARVYSTYALNDEEQEAVAREFGGRVNKKIRIENIVDPTLLGGLKVAIGDTIYDGSLAGKLERLEQSFNRRVQ
ncbi:MULTISPECIES: F0F1 ATP synthase subunit delta [Paenibacillus]|uniref:ATP synthase subunit delta n=1 Tax=Paenibacillus pabuli TaxID=1472 RepID=A0A855Y3I6_9BACL|nr:MULTISPECIES: F0F1 ATP synthase subunit delta [Paenibacillus]MCZ1264131.1 F0F1 ATP synthase subunit delta [Paenibacillus tundrae]OAX46291.1 ATP synthase subunit delta [Paenibacillus sp. AD87]PWW37299.1 ATP synthase F1 subcomplex delta subunit [Paenibacillus pabuli]PXW05441.1 ATP synthase F1 subcomplex delta subunit [Paenibacillus taichungensis]WDQ33207.1 F0F1 ATP synthase subunit delta [Paenibacillus marchantiae]